MPTLKQSVDSAIDPWAVQEKISTSDARYALASNLMPRADLSYIDYVSGVMASGDGGVTHQGCRVRPAGGMDVTVEVGNVVVNTENTGPYQGALDSRKTLSLAPSSTSTNRIDIVLVRVYDDQNPLLGSQMGVRKLAVEVWTGDPSTGVPPVPTIPLGAGWHPLAYVRVNANTSALTDAMITDMRGPGLVTRGGIRPFYGVDASKTGEYFNAPGAYPGEQRWIHTNGFQHQIFYGDNGEPKRSGWRGVHNALVYNANPSFGGSGVRWFKGGGINEICRVRIPYPGTPFMIYPTGRAEIYFGPGVEADVRITVDAPHGRAVNWTTQANGVPGIDRITGWGAPLADRTYSVTVPPVMFGPFTGDLDVILSGHLNVAPSPAGAFGWGIHTGSPMATLLSVVVYPSTVQPPNPNQGNDGSGDDLAQQG